MRASRDPPDERTPSTDGTVRRRQLLAGAALGAGAVLGGCLFGGADGCGNGLAFEMDGPLDDEGVATRESRSVDRLNPVARRLVETAADEGSATYATPSDPPVEAGTVLRLDGAYERVTVTAGAETTVTGYDYELATDEEIRKAATESETVAVADLPAHDAATFVSAFGGKADGIRDRAVAGATLSMLVAYADADERESSVFVPDPDYRYVRYGETVFRVRLVETREVTVVTYRVGTEQVAASASAYAEQIRDESGRHVDPDSLSADARAFVEDGMEEHGTSACYPLPDHVTAVLDAFGIDPEASHADRYVEYGSEWYDASIAEFHAD
ncbi:MAG: hypothetical protein ABEJ06_01815 [Haloarculaceae archaeon]